MRASSWFPNATRSTSPAPVRGSWSRISTWRGYMCRGMRCLQKATSSLGVAWAPGRSRTKPLAMKPTKGSGTPITAASATAGCACNPASTAAAETSLPSTTKTSSLMGAGDDQITGWWSPEQVELIHPQRLGQPAQLEGLQLALGTFDGDDGGLVQASQGSKLGLAEAGCPAASRHLRAQLGPGHNHRWLASFVSKLCSSKLYS